jgi:hypothetical protein
MVLATKHALSSTSSAVSGILSPAPALNAVTHPSRCVPPHLPRRTSSVQPVHCTWQDGRRQAWAAAVLCLVSAAATHAVPAPGGHAWDPYEVL